MAKIREREQARLLRAAGRSIAEIAKDLHVSKSTASYWCRDIPLSEEAIDKLTEYRRHEGVKALLRAAEKKRQRRITETAHAQDQGRHDVGAISKRDIFFIGLGLYWGEGYKHGNEEFGFTNSDPEMIRFFIRWLHTAYGVKREDLTLRVSINAAHSQRVGVVEHYWSALTKVPLSQFTKTSLIKIQSSKVYSAPDTHYGTLRIKIRRGSQLRRRVLGSIQAVHLR